MGLRGNGCRLALGAAALALLALPAAAQGAAVILSPLPDSGRGLDRPGLDSPVGPSFEAAPLPRGSGWYPRASRPAMRGRLEQDDGAPAAPAETYERAWTSFPHAPPAPAAPAPVDIDVVVPWHRRR